MSVLTQLRKPTNIAQQDRLTTSPYLIEYFGICEMTLSRWLKDEQLAFPKPMRINGRRYWRWSDIEVWIGEKLLP